MANLSKLYKNQNLKKHDYTQTKLLVNQGKAFECSYFF